MTAKVRQSNFELLRILCMLGVVTNHVLQNCYPQLHTTDFGIANDLRVLLMGMSITAVNCFVMISGYFRIRQSWKGFFNLYTQCAFWMFVLTTLSYLFVDGTIMDIGKKTLFSLTGSGYWFVVAYFALFLLAPLLNIAFEHQTHRQRLSTLIAMLLMDVYVGYMHQAPEVTIDGYSVLHFIVIYYIGMYLSTISNINSGGVKWLSFSVSMVLMHAIKLLFPPFAIVFSMRYNSPAVMIASVLLFCWAKTWRIQSKAINWISASVLSVYIIHMGPFGSHYFFTPLKYMSAEWSALRACWGMVVYVVLFYGCCILLDKVRIWFCMPINKWLVCKATSATEYLESKLFPNKFA